ncbi:uncharacterized protein BP5553_10259 [Venustampulla echinocandica]|uniref:Uncharacterized protein n=1 Tax=Venustampulla echinocandica TaxID=2656787 RepID=A0A370T9R0_9HELO|nr:uncharacterized protein BP5553_10259 [Venustampulla echinocandica]RDL30381.1 hypothetical protein BP5553_10259 [Venustampulla echinocandica]
MLREDDFDESDVESCFDIEDEHDVNTEPTDVDTDAEDTVLIDIGTGVGDADLTDINTDYEGCDRAVLEDLSWIANEDNAHPLEYYLDQECIRYRLEYSGPTVCFHAAIANGNNILLLIPEKEIDINEELEASVSQLLSELDSQMEAHIG